MTGHPHDGQQGVGASVTMLLEPIYEQGFIDGSYGFRLNRNTHDALEVIRQSLMQMGGGWVLDVDVQKEVAIYLSLTLPLSLILPGALCPP